MKALSVMSVVAMVTVTAGSLCAQTTALPRSFCWGTRPLPACTNSFIYEIDANYAITTSSRDAAPESFEGPREALGSHAVGQFGVLHNISPGSAVGVTFGTGVSTEGARHALEVRYRRWLGETMSADATAGIVRTEINSYENNNQTGLTAAVRFNPFRSVGFTLRYDVVNWDTNHPTTPHFPTTGQAHALYGGVTLANRGAVIGTAVGAAGAITLAAFALAVCGGGNAC